MALLELKNVKYNSRSQPIIKGISMKINEGETVAITGKSGSGKSTLLKLIAGILVPAEGSVSFDGVNINLMSKMENRNFRRRTAFVFQDAALWANQDILANVSLPLRIHFPNLSNEERLAEVENMCKIVKYERSLSLRPADLSMGEQKQIAFARAMICKPEVLFLDECTESLDSRGAQVIVRLLHEFEEAGHTMVYVTHNTAFLREFKGSRYLVDDGKLESADQVGEEKK